MYRHFGIELTEEGLKAMSQYMIDNPRDNRPPHRFNFGSPDVIARARGALRSYQDYFGIPIEYLSAQFWAFRRLRQRLMSWVLSVGLLP